MNTVLKTSPSVAERYHIPMPDMPTAPTLTEQASAAVLAALLEATISLTRELLHVGVVLAYSRGVSQRANE